MWATSHHQNVCILLISRRRCIHSGISTWQCNKRWSRMVHSLLDPTVIPLLPDNLNEGRHSPDPPGPRLPSPTERYLSRRAEPAWKTSHSRQAEVTEASSSSEVNLSCPELPRRPAVKHTVLTSATETPYTPSVGTRKTSGCSASSDGPAS